MEWNLIIVSLFLICFLLIFRISYFVSFRIPNKIWKISGGYVISTAAIEMFGKLIGTNITSLNMIVFSCPLGYYLS